jgi:hypothetical protein
MWKELNSRQNRPPHYSAALAKKASPSTPLSPLRSPSQAELSMKAGFAKDGLSAVKSRENISRMIDLQSAAVSSNLSVEQAFQLKRNAFNAQVMFTNLGRLPFDTIFGPLKLETLWAPCALRGIEAEQTLGAVSVNGSLHLTHSSPAPIPGLLASVEEVLRKACAIYPNLAFA